MNISMLRDTLVALTAGSLRKQMKSSSMMVHTMKHTEMAT